MSTKQIIGRCLIIFVVALALIPAHSSTAQTSSGTTPMCSTPPATINVWIVDFAWEWPAGTTFLMGIPFEDYVYGVVMGELGPRIIEGPYAGQAWSDQVLQAQSVAARTWGSYWCHKWSFNGGQGVKNSVPDQVYRPNDRDFDAATKQHYIDVSYAMRDIYIAYDGLLVQSPYDGKLLDAEYRRDPGNPTCTWLNGDQRAGCLLNGQRVFGYDYLRSVNNPYTIGYTDGGGWAQTPSHGWTQANDHRASWYQTLVHYYTGISMMNKEPTFTAQYWNNTDCSGAQVTSNTTNNIDYDWGTGSPAPGVNTDNFCVYWSNTVVNFPYSDWYTFFVLADDGFRLYFDSVLILDRWQDQSPAWYSVSLPVTAGNHSIALRYYDHTFGAVARMSWTRGRGMIGSYYDQTIPKTDPITAPAFILHPDALIQFDWGIYSPLDTREGSRILEDTFAGRWQGEIYVPSCRWVTFNTRSDDGVYMKFNNAALIDNWNDHGPTDNTAPPQWLCPGTYPLRVRYYENGGGAVINVSWQ